MVALVWIIKGRLRMFEWVIIIAITVVNNN